MGYKFVNTSIKWRFPKNQTVRIQNPSDILVGVECKIIGWTGSRVRLLVIETQERITRVPKNLSKPY